MARVQPIAVTEKVAAEMVMMRVEEFRVWRVAVELRPCNLAGFERYSVAEIQAKLRGDVEAPEDRW